MGLGTIVFDFETWPLVCDNHGFLRIEGCYGLHWIEELVELLAVWLTLVAVLGLFSNVAPQLSHRHTVYPHIAPAIIFLLLLLYSAAFSYGFDELRHLPLRLSVRHALSEMSPAAVHFEPDIHLRGFTINVDNEATAVRLYSSAGLSLTHRLGQSVHLVDQDSGKSIASQDKIWCCPSILQVDGPNCARKCKRERIYPDWLQNEPIYHQRFEIYVPPSAPTNRAYWIVLTLWRKGEGEFARQKVLASDHRLLSDTQVVLGEMVLPASSVARSTVPLATFDNGFALEAVAMPQSAQAGETLRIPFSWISDEDGHEDHTQFLHFGNVENGEWWVYDQQPLGDRLPTRLWYRGLADTELWDVPLPPDLAPGRYEVFTGLYRSRDLERVPAKDADGVAWLDGRVLLGNLIIE